MVRKSGGQQSETVCPTIGTENNMSDVEEDSELSIEGPNSELKDEAQLVETETNNDISVPLLPLITELGFNNHNEDSE